MNPTERGLDCANSQAPKERNMQAAKPAQSPSIPIIGQERGQVKQGYHFPWQHGGDSAYYLAEWQQDAYNAVLRAIHDRGSIGGRCV